MDAMKFLNDNILMVGLAAVSGALLVGPMLRGGSGGSSVDTLQATLMMNKENALILDVREETEYASGHIVGARNLPLVRLGGSTDVADTISKKKDRPIVVCCATGARSSAAVKSLKKMGFERAYNLSGGINAWIQAGLPTEK